MKNLMFFVTLVGMLASCTTIKYTSFERLYGADVNFPEQVKSIGIVNCVPSVNTGQDWAVGVANSYEGEGKITAEALAQKIAETRYFDQVIICDSVIIPSGPESTLSGSQIDSLIYSLGVDMLLAVERVQLEMTTDEMWFSEVRREIPVLCVGITPLVGAYKEMRDRPLFKVCKTDTLYWELPLSQSLEIVKEDASQYAATIPMKHLLPYWAFMSAN